MLRNLVKETAAAPGTNTSVQLAGAVAGFNTFVQGFGTGQQVYYIITNGTLSEVQSGTITSGTPATLTRGTPIWTSTGSASRLNFTGAVTVYCALPAERALWADASAVYQAQSRRLANLADGISAQDAATLTQTAWRFISQTVFGTAQTSVVFTLPAGFARFRVEFMDFAPSAAAQPFARFSVNGGVSYLSGGGDYGYVADDIRSGGGLVSGAQSFVPLHTINTTLPVFGSVDFIATGYKFTQFDTNLITSTPALSRFSGASNCANFTTATHILLGFTGVNCAAGRLRLLGAMA